MSARERFGALALTALLTWTGAAATPLEEDLRAEVDRFVTADRSAPPPICQVLFVGSSSLVKWRKLLAADMAPLPVIDRGFGGSHIEYINRWFDEVVAPYRPRAIVFYAGENDLDAGKPPSRVLADFDTFLELKVRSLGSTPVYFIALKPSKARFAQLAAQSAVNDAVRARARERSDLIFLDVVPAMLANGRPKDLYENDGLHMRRAGYLLWTAIVRPALLAHATDEERSCRHRWQH